VCLINLCGVVFAADSPKAAPTVVALVLMSTHGPPLMVLLIKLFELFCHKLKDVT